MKSFMEPAIRARRLLKLYPSSWRERYGAEFVDFMEQSIADDPHNAKRTINIIYKSAKVRLNDLGVVGVALDETRASNVALGTSTFLSSIFVVFALFYWSTAMMSWNSDPRVATSVGVSIWMGAITVSAILLSLTLLSIGLVLIFRALRKALIEREGKLFAPIFVVFASAAVIVNSTYQYTRWSGIHWTGAGIVLKQLAGVTQWVTMSTIWGPSWTGRHVLSGEGLLHYGTPIAVIALAFSIANIARRLDYSPKANRTARAATKLLTFSMISFLLSFAGWTLAGGFDRSWVAPFTQMATSLLSVIIFIAILTLVIAFKSRTIRNAIEIVN